MLNDDQIDQLADILNESVDIPFTGEGTEKDLLVRMLNQLGEQIPAEASDEVFVLVNSIADGSVDESEAVEMKSRAVDIINEYVDVPFVGEGAEASLLEPIIDVLVNTARSQLE